MGLGRLGSKQTCQTHSQGPLGVAFKMATGQERPSSRHLGYQRREDPGHEVVVTHRYNMTLQMMHCKRNFIETENR